MHSAATSVMEQLFHGISLLPPQWEGSRKSDVKKACLFHSFLSAYCISLDVYLFDQNESEQPLWNLTEMNALSLLEPGILELV